MFIKNLRISNLRSIAGAEVDFCYPGREDPPDLPNVTLLLGDNGVGKTSVLRAVALATLSPVIESSGFSPYNLVRRTRRDVTQRAELRADVMLHAQDLKDTPHRAPLQRVVETAVERRQDHERLVSAAWEDDVWEGMFRDRTAAFLVVGYSAGRRVEGAATFDSAVRAKTRRTRYQRVAGLFEEGVSLTPLSSWLPQFRSQNPGRYSQVVTLMNDLLPEGTELTGELENEEYLFQHNETRVPFAAMSDGYRAYIGWVADLLYHVCMGAPSGKKLVDNHGIVLVDEIDLHLHPAWQREVVPQLARALPNLQFVLTTHSPIVTGTLQAKNIRVLEPDGAGATEIRRLNERVHGLNADQILVSSYFGLDTTRAPAAVDALQKLSRQARQGDKDAVHAFLKQLSADSESWQTAETAGAADAEGRPAAARGAARSASASGRKTAAATKSTTASSRSAAGGSASGTPPKRAAASRRVTARTAGPGKAAAKDGTTAKHTPFKATVGKSSKAGKTGSAAKGAAAAKSGSAKGSGAKGTTASKGGTAAKSAAANSSRKRRMSE